MPQPSRSLGTKLALSSTPRPMLGKAHEMGKVDTSVWSSMMDCAEGGGPWPLVFVGDVGTGKTCAALCLLDWVAKSRMYVTVPIMCDELIAVQNGQREYGQRKDSLLAWWHRWNDLGCCVVDELGSRTKVSDFQYETVKRAIDLREDAPAVFISNLSLDELAKVYDDRIASRLAGGTVIHFTGDDRRLAR